MNRDRLIAQLKSDESDEQFCYLDQFGYHTIGIGRCIDKRKGKGLSKAERLYLLNNDIDDWVGELKQLLPWFDALDDVRQEVLINMSHQMGIDGLLKFKNFLQYLKFGDYKHASEEMMDSVWAKEQTPGRAKRLANMILTGVV